MSNAVKEEHSPAIISPSSINTTAAAVHKKILSSNNEHVEKLAQITNRKRHDIEQSLTRLYDSDVKKINELCRNYSKLQHYSSKLITKEEFKNEIQKEIGRELRPYQLTIAANSIRRVQLYIENILDNKFVHDASHGINHVKHNLEYGYQLMNLIEGPRRIKRQMSQ